MNVAAGITADGEGVLIAVKAVPGAKRDEIAGWLGDRLKVRDSAPPEDGRANDHIREVVAEALGVATASVSIVHGRASPMKTLRVCGIDAPTARARLEALS